MRPTEERPTCGSAEVQLTYRFDPPAQENDEDLFVGDLPTSVGYFSQ